ncbi:MAG TPA: HAD-IIB family hydrolase [Burkholderiales bacterium]|nr:HAD-IIB family hydrolase [Burkholderiales bacterium]
MRPLAELDACAIRGVLFDIDDTLTTDGKLGAEAYAALERLKQAGKLLVPVTGRPAGWCDHIARMWPVDAVVGENGAFYFWHDAQAGGLARRYLESAAARAERRAQLEAIARDILQKVPGCALAADQAYRETDLAIDYCEDVPALPLEAAERIAALMREAGLSAKVSSIHVNGWFGSYDKLTMCRTLLAERFGVDADADNRAWVFVGDSPNDAPMFGFFAHSVGVANVKRFGAQLVAAPKFVTQAAAGAGFAELAAHLLKGA